MKHDLSQKVLARLPALPRTSGTLLEHCEQERKAFPYDPTIRTRIPYRAQGTRVIVISDLHMGAGLQHDQSYNGCENFYADASFTRFLSFLRDRHPVNEKLTLIINGDFVDFLRIVAIPESDADFMIWQRDLNAIGYSPMPADLRATVQTEAKEGYGLKTDDYKSIWKLRLVQIGHPDVFAALADWVGAGNELIITKGNHDLEWIWLRVRNMLRLILAEGIARNGTIGHDDALEQFVFPNVLFFDNSIVLNDNVYVEHGHLYDNFTNVLPQPDLIVNDTQLNLPTGSFFNRYLLNKLELRYPYMENVRPRQAMLPTLIKTDFPLALSVFGKYIPKLIKLLSKKLYTPLVMQALLLAAFILIPAGLALVLWGNQIWHYFSTAQPSKGMFQTTLENIGISFGLMVLSYLMPRLLAHFQLEEPDSLLSNAIAPLADHAIVTFGHTHDPEQYEHQPGKWYYNTGTWIPIIETSSVNVREDKTYTFLDLSTDTPGAPLKAKPLMRWNDDASRIDRLLLVRNASMPIS